MRPFIPVLFIILAFMLNACGVEKNNQDKKINVLIEAEMWTDSDKPVTADYFDYDTKVLRTNGEGWIAFDVDVPVAGRYKSQIRLANIPEDGVNLWIEDHVDNKDDRTYNITSNIFVESSAEKFVEVHRDGSPLNKGLHKMKLHFNQAIDIDYIKFSLIREHEITPDTLTQSVEGKDWVIAWSDEFNGDELDTSKWTYDIGNWGWGNFEDQYYTVNRKKNVRIENGNLIIEAHKNDMGEKWTSARLTTRGKVSFLYGKIEFRAKVPPYKGNWAAGWTLGDEYVDELSWPYCGEIDILESVGYEMDDETGNGIAHASAHSRAYYFKLGNQPTATIPVKKMNTEYHTYAVEWTPDYLKIFVDDIHYFTYDDTSSEKSWPFNKPQNLILNLAIGGGWGGAMGMDENVTNQKMIIDYVRVYELK